MATNDSYQDSRNKNINPRAKGFSIAHAHFPYLKETSYQGITWPAALHP
jgi:hypothetical protein